MSIDCSELADALYDGVDISQRKHRLRSYDDVFLGSEAVDWLVASGAAHDRLQAVAMGQLLLAGDVEQTLGRQLLRQLP